MIYNIKYEMGKFLLFYVDTREIYKKVVGRRTSMSFLSKFMGNIIICYLPLLYVICCKPVIVNF